MTLQEHNNLTNIGLISPPIYTKKIKLTLLICLSLLRISFLFAFGNIYISLRVSHNNTKMESSRPRWEDWYRSIEES